MPPPKIITRRRETEIDMLEYKALTVAKAEQKYGRGFIGFISSMKNTQMGIIDGLFLLEAGGMTESEAAELIDTKGFNDSVAGAMKVVVDAGFLGKGKQIQEAREKAKEALSTLETSGENQSV